MPSKHALAILKPASFQLTLQPNLKLAPKLYSFNTASNKSVKNQDQTGLLVFKPRGWVWRKKWSERGAFKENRTRRRLYPLPLLICWVTWVWFGNSVGAGDASRSNLVVGLEWTAPGDDSYLGKGGGFCQLNNWIFSQIYPTWRQEHIVLLAMKRLFVCSQPLRDKDGHHLGELERGEFRQQGYPSPCLPHTHTSR